MDARVPAVALFLLAVALSGCANGQFGSYGDGKEILIGGNGQKTGSESKNLECSSEAQVAVGFNGQGTIKVTVKDGSGAKVYEKSFNGNGQEGETKEIPGEPGTWKLTVSFSGTYVGGWNGQYGIYLRC